MDFSRFLLYTVWRNDDNNKNGSSQVKDIFDKYIEWFSFWSTPFCRFFNGIKIKKNIV